MGFSSIENYKLTYFIYFTLVDSKQLNLRKSINFVSIELIILIILLILFYLVALRDFLSSRSANLLFRWRSAYFLKTCAT